VYFTLTDAFHSRPDQSQPESPRDAISAVVVLCVFDFDSCFHSRPDQSQPESPRDTFSAVVVPCVFDFDSCFHSRPDQSQTESSRDTVSAVVVLCVFDFDSCFSFQTRPVTTRVPTRYNQRWCDFVDFYPTHYSTCGRLYVLRHPSSRKRVYLPHVDASHSGRHSCRYFCCTIT